MFRIGVNEQCLGTTTCRSDGDRHCYSRQHPLSGGHNTRTQYQASRDKLAVSKYGPSPCSLRNSGCEDAVRKCVSITDKHGHITAHP